MNRACVGIVRLLSMAGMAVVLMALVVLGIGGCARGGAGGDGMVDPAVAALPTYAAAARAYNARLEGVDEFFATGVIALAFVDEQGRARRETGECTLQFVQPDRLALTLSKAGQRAMWLGFDAERFWRIDLIEDRAAYVGRHAGVGGVDGVGGGVGGGGGGGLGADLPLLSVVLGLTRLREPGVGDAADGSTIGATQWSSDGRLLGITSRLGWGGGGGEVVRRGMGGVRGEGGAGFVQRVWVEPRSSLPRQIEVFWVDGGRGLAGDPWRGVRAVLVSELDEDGRIEMRRGGFRPMSPGRIVVHVVGGAGAAGAGDGDDGIDGGDVGASVRLRLGTMRNGPVSEDAVDFERLLNRLGISRVIDLDARGGGG